MNAPEFDKPLNQLNQYLDGLMSPTEGEEFAQRLAGDAALRDDVALQRQIDSQLQVRFRPPAAPPLNLNDLHEADRTPAHQNGKARSPRRSAQRSGPDVTRLWRALRPGQALPRWLMVSLVGMASIAVTLLLWNWLRSTGDRNLYRERPLTEVLQQTMDQGFKPEYAYEGEERMRTVFFVRHGQALKLGDLPADRRVLGLSYLPSLSRHSTAILAQAAGQPVMVFVDKLSRDPNAADPTVVASRSDLRVFRRQLGNLVIYEVGPFEEPQILSFLLPAEPPPDACLVD